ncbi:MAG: hypothetical protein RLZZ126_573 [Pseudomonadota bacterium]|jgi:uracil-DNA glycosylase
MSLDLDERQRAMLAEMGVRVWAPERPAVVMPVAPPTAPATAPERFAPPPQPVALVSRVGAVGDLNWADLQDTVKGCRACGLCEGRQHTVFGAGPTGANGQPPRVDWLVVGEAPGEQEDLRGEPFVGQAGKLLDNMLLAIGLKRTESVFIANVIKCRPPHNRNPESAEIAQCSPLLHRQIALLQPKIILGLGRFSVNTLLAATVPDVEKMPLGRLRGQVHRYLPPGEVGGAGIPVVASYHPAYLLRNLPEKAKSWADLVLAVQTLKDSS